MANAGVEPLLPRPNTCVGQIYWQRDCVKKGCMLSTGPAEDGMPLTSSFAPGFERQGVARHILITQCKQSHNNSNSGWQRIKYFVITQVQGSSWQNVPPSLHVHMMSVFSSESLQITDKVSLMAKSCCFILDLGWYVQMTFCCQNKNAPMQAQDKISFIEWS